MLATLAIVAPVFGIMLLGLISARSGYLPPGADRAIAQFGFKVVMPAFLLRALLTTPPLVDPPCLPLLGYFTASALTWTAASLCCRYLLRRPAPDQPAVAMGACFGNVVMLGIPLAVAAFGTAAEGPAAMIVAIDTPILWLVATLHMEWALRGRFSVASLKPLALDLLQNPIILAVLIGLLLRLIGFSLPPVADRFLEFLARPALPVTLFALGMSLAAFELKGQTRTIAVITLAKMTLYPALAYIMLVKVLAVPPIWREVGMLFAAMPVGANAFLFAAKYERAVGSVSAAIALSTLLSVVTASTVIYVLLRLGP